jgi:hypothetical protein
MLEPLTPHSAQRFTPNSNPSYRLWHGLEVCQRETTSDEHLSPLAQDNVATISLP